jgi:hypothetical protein
MSSDWQSMMHKDAVNALVQKKIKKKYDLEKVYVFFHGLTFTF